MRIICISLLRCLSDGEEVFTIAEAFDLMHVGSIQRVREVTSSINGLLIKSTPMDHRSSVLFEECIIHIHKQPDGLCGSATCDKEYPACLAHAILRKLMNDFAEFKSDWGPISLGQPIVWPQLLRDISQYQDPARADQSLLDEANRMESIEINDFDDVVHRSGDLAVKAKYFFPLPNDDKSNATCILL